MTDNFECLEKGCHNFSLQCPKGSLCVQCGMMYLPDSKLGYKSSRYSSKVHFAVADYEATLLEDSAGYRMSNSSYLQAREKMVKFILDKGRVLKMSLKTLHQCIFLMDCFCERMHSFPVSVQGPADRHLLIAGSALLLGSKACELDERIPFISKLKKYTDLNCFSNQEFKQLEVAIGESLQWDLQRTTFYSFVEMYLAFGILSEDDRISKDLVDKILARVNEDIPGAEDGVRYLAKGEQSRVKITTAGMVKSPSEKGHRRASSSVTLTQFVRLGSLPPKAVTELIKVFELYTRDLCNLIVRDCTGYWVFPKPAVALSLILYARSSMMDPTCIWSPRVQGVTGVGLDSISDPFSQIEEFIRLGVSPVDNPNFSPKLVVNNNRQLITVDLSEMATSTKPLSSNFSSDTRGALRLANVNQLPSSSHVSGMPSLIKISGPAEDSNSKNKAAAPGPKLRRMQTFKENSPAQ